MSEPQAHTPEWYNDIGKRARKRILALSKPAIDKMTKGGYIGGFTPVGLRQLEGMPVQTAIQMITGLMQFPDSRAEGVRLFAGYLTWLEGQNVLAPGAAKRLSQQFGVSEAQMLSGAQASGVQLPQRMNPAELLARRTEEQQLAAQQQAPLLPGP